MNSILEILQKIFTNNGLVTAFLFVGIVSLIAEWLSKLTKGRIHASAIAIFLGLLIAYIGGCITGGSKGIADISVLAGVGVLGGSSLRDFAIISTAFGAKASEIKKHGPFVLIAPACGVVLTYLVGLVMAVLFGYRDTVSITTIAAGTVTFIVGSVTGAAIGADSTVIAIAIAAGLVKSIAVMLMTPLLAKKIGLTTPSAAMIYGGLIGSASGTTAGLSATDPELVPYGAMTATFYTGIGCLLCPSVLYALTKAIFG